jgi:hypothetical protein
VTGLQVGAVRATILRSVHHSGEGTLAESVRTLIASSVALKPSQEIVLATLAERGAQELVRAEYEAIAGVSRSQAAYDIAELVALGMLERVGSGRATRYRVAPQAVGRPRKWTDERIRQELAEFHSLLGRWPRAADFRESGRTDLYLAACRNGGLERWAGELDPKADRNDKGPRSAADGKRWLSYALVLTACLGVLTVAAPSPREQNASPTAAAGGVVFKTREAPSLAAIQNANGTKAALLITARDDSWLAVRRRSGDGRVVFQDILARGASVRVTGTAVWLRLNSPSSFDARLNGDPIRLPGRPGIFLVTPAGIQVVAFAPPPSGAPEASDGGGITAPPLTAGTTSATTPAQSTQTIPAAPAPDSSPSPDPAPSGPGPDSGRSRG